ncbi:MAG: U32 family peptidase [Gemmataceae bacterium]|nr:U32 family peptidase [Gemmataceae bacterium]MDW8265539.1 U32 family peptidase [Gemmataceae bacterium]
MNWSRIVADGATSTTERITLPLLTGGGEVERADSEWAGWTVVGAVPELPQGSYNPAAPEPALTLPPVGPPTNRPVELLAPAGGPEAGYAALHFGADAIYLGLKKFSARAEAENFTLEEVDEITAYAHSLRPPRRVFVTINTVIRQDELAELLEAVAGLADIGVDALIVQDLGVYYLVRQYFPQLELHASTQLAVHNRAGAETLRRLGFRRVVLARELTFEEIRDITAESGIETEVFIHGALCYSYSGLCLFSAQTLGRSGNRGKCAYSCRDAFEVRGAPLTLRDGRAVLRDPRHGFPFSMKDLALPDHLPALRSAGVSCFKIEGRKKGPLYVATTTDFYRRLLDGRLPADERPRREADLRTVFSRPWTRLFIQSPKDKEVADRDTVGHRGTPIGQVEAVVGDRRGRERLRFRTSRSLERHDGLQIDLPTLGKPFGFAIDHLWELTPGRPSEPREVLRVEAGARVEVALPAEHPVIPRGATVYCSSSQAVKQRYRHERPKPGVYRIRRPLHIEAELSADRLTVVGRVAWGPANLEVRRSLAGPFPRARRPEAMEETLRTVFEKLGDTRWALASLALRNDGGWFVPVSRLNAARRDLVAELETAWQQVRAAQVERLRKEVCPSASPRPVSASRQPFRWSIMVDRASFLDGLEPSDWEGIDEIIIDIARDHPTLLRQKLDLWAERVGRDRIRLALPALTRSWEDRGLRLKIEQLRGAGWHRWQAANLSAWGYLELDPTEPVPPPLDLAADWSLYVVNRLAARQLVSMGVSRFTLSPEDGLANLRSLVAEFGPRAVVIVYQDTPLFLAESCAYANLIGGCPGKAQCRFESMEMVSEHGERVTALDYHCRTIVLNQGPYCLAPRLSQLSAAGAVCLRADFVYRSYDPHDVRQRWRLVRAGRAVPGGHAANFERGLL